MSTQRETYVCFCPSSKRLLLTPVWYSTFGSRTYHQLPLSIQIRHHCWYRIDGLALLSEQNKTITFNQTEMVVIIGDHHGGAQPLLDYISVCAGIYRQTRLSLCCLSNLKFASMHFTFVIHEQANVHQCVKSALVQLLMVVKSFTSQLLLFLKRALWET